MTLSRHPHFRMKVLLDTTHPAAIFIAQFSAVRTLRRIFTMEMKNNSDSFDFLNGLRVLSLFWVIFGHTFVFNANFASNSIDALAWSQNIAFQLIVSGLFSVDTFFVLSGFLTAVLFIRQITKEKLTFRLFILYYIHRYIRLTPTFVLVILVSINLTPYFGRGPLYPSKQGFEPDGCSHRGWWLSILYIGNLFKSDDICLSASWYLHNDMQFHWIAPLALIPFVIGRKSIAFIMATLFVLVGIGVPGLNRSALIAYHTLSRPCWALCIGWLVFLCSTNQGGTVNTILSWPIWTPLARLNYSTYLIHVMIIFITIYNQSTPIYVAAIVVVIFFETPFFILEKKLFKR
ncbi:unnamed protein product [Rotaria sordida]|uniref:Acyltransferase 3 domain-containing protein n=1 Tax=Rotaria sordida TaxID=392033 RepID=A0A819JRG6_9BILA|nr:unnamed protein product [Rotaria sordida]CAF3933992.1 unnamed protein product [Rotaria sordida]